MSGQQLELVIRTRERDLGGFTVRRLLPYATHRMVGPFIFFDHMGPAVLAAGKGMDVRPHPHIGLATVTYLFKGVISHRDSLGSVQDIEPGAINWMTAGRGIVHSERSPARVRESGGEVHGIQLWVALPTEHEETDPSFTHYPAKALPEFKVGDVGVKLLIGALFDRQSPVKTHSDLFYAEVKTPKGSRLTLKSDGRERAVYLVGGDMRIDGSDLAASCLAVLNKEGDVEVEALSDTHLMLLGGSPVGQRFIWWNLVSSSETRLAEARELWAEGPKKDNPRFQPIPGDDREFIPLPEEPAPNPKGTIM